MADAKRHRPFSAWPNVTLTGPGGENGADLLRELAGDPDTLEAVFACTMGLNAAAILQMMGCRCDVFAVFACHHPERCWQGDPSERRHPKTAGEEPAVEGYPDVRLLFPPFCDAPERRPAYEQRHQHQAPRGLIGCVHPKLLLFFRAESLRVVVATANLTKGGWTCTRNHLWQQEFPARTDADADADWLRLLPDGGFASEIACLVASLMVRPRHQTGTESAAHARTGPHRGTGAVRAPSR